MSHHRGSATIRRADDGTFIIEGTLPHEDYPSNGPSMSSCDEYFVTQTAPDVPAALEKAAAILKKKPDIEGTKI